MDATNTELSKAKLSADEKAAYEKETTANNVSPEGKQMSRINELRSDFNDPKSEKSIELMEELISLTREQAKDLAKIRKQGKQP
jgi:hypothetical protein